jgi:predicted transcriptional regulator
MTDYKIQSMADLEAEMRAAARGEKAPPEGAAQPSVESADVLIRLLTPENRDLLKTIRDERPQSVADLARRTKRAEPNLLRTLAKLEAVGLVEMRLVGRRRVPFSRVGKLRFEIDPYSQNDRVEFA